MQNYSSYKIALRLDTTPARHHFGSGEAGGRLHRSKKEIPIPSSYFYIMFFLACYYLII